MAVQKDTTRISGVTKGHETLDQHVCAVQSKGLAMPGYGAVDGLDYSTFILASVMVRDTEKFTAYITVLLYLIV